MAKRTVVSMPGDGIGKVCLEQAIRVLEAAGFEAEWVHADIGWGSWCKEGNALPQRTIDLLAKHKVGFFGAITSKPKEKAEEELDPSLKGKGLVYSSPIVGMRQHFDLDLCIRPCKSLPGNPLNFVRRNTDGTIVEPKVDVVVFRQNTECLYAGVEWTNPPADVRKALETHKKMQAFKWCPSEDLALSVRVFTRKYTQRIIRAAFEHAKLNGYKSVTVCEKPNVVRETSGMMWSEARAISKDYPGIQLWDTNIDAQMMWLTKTPEDYGVIVAGNLFGDIVSDGFAGLIGGLGFACSANIGKDVAVFEPTHGSAPKYADYPTSIVNPIAAVLSGVMMLEHLGEKTMAKRVHDAVTAVVAEGKVRTYDMMRMKGSPKVLEQGAASTEQMADAIIAKLEGKGGGGAAKPAACGCCCSGKGKKGGKPC